MPTPLTLAAAKFWVALVGTVTAAILAAWTDAPRWLFIANAAIAATAVYLVPNRRVEQGPEVGADEGDARADA